MVETSPAGLIRLRDNRVVPRRSGWLEPGEPLRCPFDHIVNPLIALHEGAATVHCKVRSDVGHAHCGCPLYVATGTMGLFWVDITAEEQEHINLLGIRPTGVARFLGIHFPK